MLTYPNIDPILIEIGPLAIRWYSLAYLFGIIFGGWYIAWLNRKEPVLKDLKPLDDMLVYAVLGIILGGRLGYALFYQFEAYLQQPLALLKIWEGGMSFHGGLVGFTLAMLLFARKKHYSFLSVMDLCACAVPIGLFFGRVANFINGELYGRVTESPLGMVFPLGGPEPRHPSQLYEAVLEGLVLFLLLLGLARVTKARHYPGVLAGLFLIGYGAARFTVEFFREPDAHLGFIFGLLSMGQLLSLPMVLAGCAVVIYGVRCNRRSL